MKKRKLVRKSLKKLKKLVKKPPSVLQLSRKNSRIIQCVLFVILAFGVSFGISNIAPFLETHVPENNENWAVALIAIPIALFGVWLSIHLPCLKKYNNAFSQTDLNRTYNGSIHWFDLESFFKFRLIFDFLLWVISYFDSDYAKMVAYSFVMVGDLLYLICFTIWKYKQRPSEIYHNNVMRMYFKSMTKDTAKLAEQIKPLLDANDLDGAQKNIEAVYSDFWEEIDHLTLAVISDKNKVEEKDAFISIFSKLNKLTFQETNGLIMYRFMQRSRLVFEHSLHANDYLYAKQLADQILIVWYKYIDKTCNYLERFFDCTEPLTENYEHLYVKEVKELLNADGEMGYRFDLIYKVFRLHNTDVVKIIEEAKDNKVLSLYFLNMFSKKELLEMCATRQEQLDRINKSFQERQNNEKKQYPALSNAGETN